MNLGVPFETIAKVSKLSIDEVERILEKIIRKEMFWFR